MFREAKCLGAHVRMVCVDCKSTFAECSCNDKNKEIIYSWCMGCDTRRMAEKCGIGNINDTMDRRVAASMTSNGKGK